MRQKGFVLIETIIVLVVVIISMLGLYKAYSFVSINLKQNMLYDNINEIYKVNIIKKVVETYPADNYIKITSANCTNYMISDCTQLYTLLDIDYVIYNNIDVQSVLASPGTLTNTDKNYIKKLESGYKYLIIHSEKNDKDYYASLVMGGV